MDETWLLRLDADGSGPRLAVKDCIDVAGTPTTVGCRAIAVHAEPAAYDAPVVASARRGGARIVGKTNVVELCRHADGVNEWTGTPPNPLDLARIPGGSSSGSAVAVANGEADVAYGTDTGGSVRVPAACCGIAGLKTTAGRVPTHGVFEFSRTLDTVGPLARDVAGLVVGMGLLEPGITAQPEPDTPLTAARLRPPVLDEGVESAVDDALSAAGVAAEDVELPAWEDWIDAADALMLAEGFFAHRHLLERAGQLESRHVEGIEKGGQITAAHVLDCRRTGLALRTRLRALLDRYDVLALPTMRTAPPKLGESASVTYLTVPFNLAGLPAVSLPVPRGAGELPASLQLVGGWYAEEQLLAAAAHVERALSG
ncbi:MAG: amidase [Streptosporangiales bacterium]